MLITAGIPRVYELGRVFRNEGIDAQHNPEFTTCEFYKSFADLEELISMTERLIGDLAQYVNSLSESQLASLPTLDLSLFMSPFKRIEFVPALEAALAHDLPDLLADDAAEQLTSIFSNHSIPLPSSPNLPRLLDKLASIFIEPHCNEPTFIMHHPACMAPLAKSFLDLGTNQVVSARVELFIQQR
jgi:lysyl-tRNA synthetase class 2